MDNFGRHCGGDILAHPSYTGDRTDCPHPGGSREDCITCPLAGPETKAEGFEIHLKDFGWEDWANFAGSEKPDELTEPAIAMALAANWPGWSTGADDDTFDGKVAIVVDKNGVYVGGEESGFQKDCDYDEGCRIVRGLGVPVLHNDLLRAGFLPVNWPQELEDRILAGTGIVIVRSGEDPEEGLTTVRTSGEDEGSLLDVTKGNRLLMEDSENANHQKDCKESVVYVAYCMDCKCILDGAMNGGMALGAAKLHVRAREHRVVFGKIYEILPE